MFSVGAEAGSGWSVCCLGVLPPSEQMRLEEFQRGGGRHHRAGPGAVFLSRWLIHKTPPLPSPDGTGRCPVSHLGGSFLSRGAGGGPRHEGGGGSFLPGTPSALLLTWLPVIDGLGLGGRLVSCEPGPAKGVAPAPD